MKSAQRWLIAFLEGWIAEHPGLEDPLVDEVYGIDPSLASVSREEVTSIREALANLDLSIRTRALERSVTMLNDIFRSFDRLSLRISPGDWNRIERPLGILRTVDSRIPLSKTTLYLPRTVRHRRNVLVRTSQKEPDSLYDADPRAFEEIVATTLDAVGMEVQITPMTRDGGRDIVGELETPAGRVRWLLECKRWARQRKVGLPVVQRLFGVVQSEAANKGLIVTTSDFTPDARDFADRHVLHLDLWNLKDLMEWLERAVPRLKPA